jgi:dTDP-4-dehydrorhamnose reductase
LGAETDLEYADANPEHAFQVNVTGTQLIALECRARALPMIYTSTAGVFDGEKRGAYEEVDEPRPLNVYGRTKRDGEIVVETTLERYLIVRAGWMFGGGQYKDHKFVAKIIEQLRAGNRTIWAVHDKLGSPTYALDFSRCLLTLIGTGAHGLYHMVCEGSGSRFDVARYIVQVLGQHDVDVVPVRSDYFAVDYPAMRPYSEVLKNARLTNEGLNKMRHWRIALREYVEAEFARIAVTPRTSIPHDSTHALPTRRQSDDSQWA